MRIILNILLLFLITNSISSKKSKTKKVPKSFPKYATKTFNKKTKAAPNECYCQLSGKLIHDTNCLCNVDHLIDYNTNKILPVVKKIIYSDFFRFYKTDVDRGCKYWSEPFSCGTQHCGLSPCLDSDLPDAMRHENQSIKAKQAEQQLKDKSCTDELTKKLSSIQGPLEKDEDIDLTASELSDMHKHWDSHDKEHLQELEKIAKENFYENIMDDNRRQQAKKKAKNKKDKSNVQQIWEKHFCDIDDKEENLIYYDLIKNPERYTGYAGAASHKIWSKIYKENCYNDVSSSDSPWGISTHLKEEIDPKFKDILKLKDPGKVLEELSCIERRVFYRAVSGLHSSVSIHLSYMWYDRDLQKFQPNLLEFEKRFEHEQGSQYIHNLYFVWMLELRALVKSAAFISNPRNIRNLLHTGDVLSDIRTQALVLELLEAAKEFNVHFDESHLFKADNAEEMMEDFRKRMYEVSSIVDCADCEKCRLWGKLQVVGLATAVRILLTPTECIEQSISIIEPDNPNRESEEKIKACANFKMNRREIVALYNGFARLSHSISYVEDFKKMLFEKKATERMNDEL